MEKDYDAGLLHLVFPNGITMIDSLIVLLTLLGSYYVVNIVYLLTLHPLAKIPGPKLCVVTRIPYWITNIKGNDYRWIQELHIKYGPVVRFGPLDVSYASRDAWKDVHGHGKGQKGMLKAIDVHIQPGNGVHSILTANHEDHARVRRIFSPAFSDRALKKQEPLFRKYVDLLISKLHELGDGGELVNMTKMYNFISFDIMAELCFGDPLGLLEKNEFSPWVGSIFDSLQLLPFVSMIGYYPPLKAIFTLFEPKWLIEQKIERCKHAEDRVNHRLQEGSDQPDIWNLVTAAEQTGQGLSLEEMHSNADLFMVAGSETTGTLLCGLTYFLCQNPVIMRQLCEEIRGSFKTYQDISFERVADLKFMTACLKEALRVYPPLPIGSPRVVPTGGWTVLGSWLPKGTRVSCHHWSTYHSEANFKDPGPFIPERWLGGEAYANDALESHQPFGYGLRNCIGQNMAMHEMKLILASVIFHFDIELSEKSRNWIDHLAFTVWHKKPLWCRFRSVAK